MISDVLALVDTKLKQYVFSEFSNDPNLSDRFEELIKFLYLSSKYPELNNFFIPVTQAVDDLWHAVILQTVNYHKLCSSLPGGHYIHHESTSINDYQSALSRKDFIHEILFWNTVYVKNFGDFSEDRLHYWFFIKNVKCALGLSLEKLNELAKLDNYFSPSKSGPSLLDNESYE